MNSRKILLFANTTWYLYNFRQSLARELLAEGWDVVLVSPPDEYGARLLERGFRWLPFSFSTRNTNPFKEILVIFRLILLYRRERPAIVHHFTIKCVLYGSIAALFCGRPPVINAVTGMGHIFTDHGIKARILRPFVRAFYRLVFSRRQCRVIFQNEDDLQHFIHSGLIDAEKTELIRGSGVDCTVFCPAENCELKGGAGVTILFASRLLREKGIDELHEAAAILRARGCRAIFLVAGDLYPENPSSYVEEDIEVMKRKGLFSFLGHVDAMRELLAKCDIVVLPSYREGTPRILLEAAAMALPVVATDIAGCRGVVVDGVSGFLVPIKNSRALADALEKLIMDAGLRLRFGMAARDIVAASFDERKVIAQTLDVYAGVLRNAQGSRREDKV